MTESAQVFVTFGARLRCLRGHDWRAIHGGPFGYLTPNDAGHTHECVRCRKRGNATSPAAMEKGYVRWIVELRSENRRLGTRIGEQRAELARLHKAARDQRAWMRGLGFTSERALRKEIKRLRSVVARMEYNGRQAEAAAVRLHSVAAPFFDKADDFDKVTGDEIQALGLALNETPDYCRCDTAGIVLPGAVEHGPYREPMNEAEWQAHMAEGYRKFAGEDRRIADGEA